MNSKNLTETTTATERLYDGKVLNLRLDTIRLPDGRSAKREIIEHKGAIAVVPFLNSHTLILVRQWRTAAGSALLEIPAGSLDEGEEPDAAAHRELGEEINFAAGRLTKLFSSYMAPGYSTEIIHTYLAQDLSPMQGQPDDDENLELVHLTLDDALARIETGEIHDAKSISALLYVDRLRHAGRLP